MPNNYDAAAWFYDGLSQIVFGKALIKAQVFLIKNIKPEASVLIVGGGTGWILEEIAQIEPAGLKITYIEISGRMINLSKNRNHQQNDVCFIHAGIEDCEITQQFDVVLTPFLFDNFLEKRIQAVYQQLHAYLKPGGTWLICDFQVQQNYKSLWQKILLQTMYLFFGWLCKVETNKLIKMDKYFLQNHYTLLEDKTFYKGFVISQVYQKQTNF